MFPNNSIIVDSTIKGNTFIKESSDDSSNISSNNGDVYYNSASNSDVNNGLKQAFIEARGKTFQALRALKLPVLPVAPRQDANIYPARDKEGNIVYEKDGVTPKPLFNGKNPSYLDANGIPHIVNHSKYQIALNTNADIKTWFVNSNTGIGTLGNKEITWIDIDAKNFDSVEACDTAFNELLEKYPILQKAWLEKTQSGGYRIGVRLATEKTFTNFKLSPGGQHVGEALGVGRFTVLSPTVGVVGVYSCLHLPENYQLPVVENLESIGVFPMDYKASTESNTLSFDFEDAKFNTEDLVEDLPNSVETPKPTNNKLFLVDLITPKNREILEGCIEDSKDKSKALTQLLNDVYGWVNWCKENQIELLDNPLEIANLAGEKLGLDADKIGRVIKSLKANLQPAAKFKGGDEACWKKINKLLNNKKKADNIPVLSQEEIEKRKDKCSYWAKRLGVNLTFHPETGELIGAWIPKAIRVAERIGDDLKFNEMTQNFELYGKEIDLNTCQIILESECGFSAGKDTAVDLFAFVGKKLGSFHPVREYLKKLDIPDNSNILDNLATRYFGNDDPLANIYMKKTLIGAVQRVLEPGSKLDTMCILYGGQGIGKSTFWSELVSVLEGKNLFTDSLQDLSNKDELAKLRRFWGLELAEIDFLFSTKAKEQFKRFLSAPDDTYRPPYARANEVVPRTCFFTGTTNKKELLNDESGARRFWIIECKGEEIPIALLKEERDLIWAAAYKAVLDGEQCFLSKDEQKLSNEANKEYQDVDPWQNVIMAYLNDNHYTEVSTSGIAENALQLDISRLDRKTSSRICAIMRVLGWEYKGKKINGTPVKMWFRPKQELTQVEEYQEAQTVPTVQAVPTVQPVPTVQAVPTVQHITTPQEIAEYPLEVIVGTVEGMREKLNDSPKDIKFVGDVFYLLGMREQNALEKDFPKTYKLMKDCVIEDICPPGF